MLDLGMTVDDYKVIGIDAKGINCMAIPFLWGKEWYARLLVSTNSFSLYSGSATVTVYYIEN